MDLSSEATKKCYKFLWPLLKECRGGPLSFSHDLTKEVWDYFLQLSGVQWVLPENVMEGVEC